MEPGEVYIALEISKISKRPLDEILSVYKKDKTKGWGYIAKSVGIKPGSPEFHQMKNNTGIAKNKGKSHKKGKNKKS